MAQGVGHDDLILSHYGEYSLRNLKFALIGLGLIIVAIITVVLLIGNEILAEDPALVWIGWPLIFVGIILIIYSFRLGSIRKSAMVAEASGDYEKAILLVSKLKDHKVISSLTMKRNASPQPVQSPQVQQQYAQPQPQPQPATASSPQPSPNPTINVNIQNVQPDSGAKNIHIQDSVVTDSDLL
ncbi:MAG: hypothetical protein QF807_08195 [Candidatus Thalassarchaeaceae archaeon]|nr:hypothetical protein [Candidatus Thalassarchaeaceae archaeon]